MEIQKSPLQKTNELSAESKRINVKIFGANRQFTGRKYCLFMTKTTDV